MEIQWKECLKQWERLLDLIEKGDYVLPFHFLIKNTTRVIGGRLDDVTIHRDNKKTIIKIGYAPNGDFQGGLIIGKREVFTITPKKPYVFSDGRDRDGKRIFIEELGNDLPLGSFEKQEG